MSLADNFNFYQAFPKCVDPSGLYPFYRNHIGGLTLADAMAWYWSLETITFTFAGAITLTNTVAPPPVGTTVSVTINGTVVVSPNSATGDFTDAQVATADTGMFAQSMAAGGLSSRQPKDRVCTDLPNLILAIRFSAGSLGDPPDAEFYFQVIIDPSDPTKYAIAYDFFCFTVSATGAGGTQVDIYFADQSFSTPHLITTGSFTINGLAFPWNAYYTTNLVHYTLTVVTTPDLSATSGSYTYPP